MGRQPDVADDRLDPVDRDGTYGVAVHDDGTHGRDTAPHDRVTVHLAGEDVAVSASEHDPRRRVVAHREDVVERLLQRGLSPALLRALLPEFGQVIDRHERH